MKAGRWACLHCGQKLVVDATVAGRTPSRFSQFVSRRRALLLASGIVVPLLAAWIIVARQAPEGEPPAASPQTALSANIPGTVASAGTAAPAVSSAGTDAGEPKFLDAGRRGTAAYARGDFASAIAGYQEAIRQNPNDLDALNNLGQGLVRAGRAAEAIPYFERAIALNVTNWAPRFNLGHAYGVLNDWPNAVTAYQSAAQVFPDDYVTYYNLGLALHKMGKEEAAIPAFEKAIALAPGEASFHLSLGISYERLQKPLEAIQAYEDYLSMLPTAPDATQVKTRIESLKKPA